MNIPGLDLNLLFVFDAIYRERNISAAAKSLGQSQPAVSNALRRLRDYAGDTLFFRSGGQMVPTRVANALAAPIGEALIKVRDSLGAVRNFDPMSSTRHFRIGCNDHLRSLIAPSIARLVQGEAPDILIEFIGHIETAQAMQEALRDSRLDLAVLPRGMVEDDMDMRELLGEEMVFVVRRDHPLLGKPITPIDLAAARHMIIGSVQPIRDMLDVLFAKYGVKRNVALVAPSSNDIPGIVEVTDLVGVMGRRFALRAQNDYAIDILESPLPRIDAQGALVWLKALHEDQGLKWLRDHIVRITVAQSSAVPRKASF